MKLDARITPAMLRGGEPEALAVLCQRRGGTVFAYCEQVLGSDDATAAAADAFARFRLAIASPDALTSAQQAEALLRSVTRRAALARGVRSPAAADGHPISQRCEGHESELLGYVEDALAPAERERFAAHLAECRSCAAALRRLQAGEHAFTRPATPLPRAVAREILTAMAAAAPVSARGQSASAVADDALLLLAGEEVGAARSMPTERPEDLDAPSAADSLDPPSPPAGPPILPRVTGPRRMQMPWSAGARAHPGRRAALLRGVARFVAVVVAAGAAGAALGIGISELTP